MTFNHLDAFLRAAPFRAFFLHLADGRALSVPSAECLTIVEESRSLFVFIPGTNETELIDLALIVSIRFSEGDVANRAKGQGAA